MAITHTGWLWASLIDKCTYCYYSGNHFKLFLWYVDDKRTLRIANELHHAFPQFTVAQIAVVVEMEITADASAAKLLEMDAARNPQPPVEKREKIDQKPGECR